MGMSLFTTRSSVPHQNQPSPDEGDSEPLLLYTVYKKQKPKKTTEKAVIIFSHLSVSIVWILCSPLFACLFVCLPSKRRTLPQMRGYFKTGNTRYSIIML